MSNLSYSNRAPKTRIMSILAALIFAYFITGCAVANKDNTAFLTENPILGIYQNDNGYSRIIFREDGTVVFCGGSATFKSGSSSGDEYRHGTYGSAPEENKWNLWFEAGTFTYAEEGSAILEDDTLYVEAFAVKQSDGGYKRIATASEMNNPAHTLDGQYDSIKGNDYLYFTNDTCKIVSRDGTYRQGRYDYDPTTGVWMLFMERTSSQYAQVWFLYSEGDMLLLSHNLSEESPMAFKQT